MTSQYNGSKIFASEARFRLWPGLLAVFLFLAAASSCAPREQAFGPQGSRPESRPGDDLAALAASGSLGAAGTANVPGLGFGQATIGESYVSALGRPCRRILFLDQSGLRHERVVCLEEDGLWVTAPDIFSSGERP